MGKSVLPSLRHLRIFAAVAELQSVRAAADAIPLSQPAVTQAIANLERQVDAVLFERHRSGSYLTAAGRALAEQTKRMFAEIEDALVAFGVSQTERDVATVLQRVTRAHIEAIAAMADGGSFTEVARKQSVPLPSLHRAARDLECNLGRPLFQRGRRGIASTGPGIELARRLSAALRKFDRAIAEARGGAVGGELRVGAMPLAGGFLLGPVLDGFAQLYPQVQVQVRWGYGPALISELQAGEVDLIVGVNRRLDPAKITQEPLFSSPYVLVARQGHPLSAKPNISACDLEAFSWIVPTVKAVRRPAFERLFARMSRAPRVIEAYSLSIIPHLLTSSDCLTLLTEVELDHEKDVCSLVALDYAPIAPLGPIGVAWRANWTATDLHKKFLELLRSHASRISRPRPRLTAGSVQSQPAPAE